VTTLEEGLKAAVHRTRHVRASLKYLRRKPDESVFTPPMVVYSKGFTKCAFCNADGPVRFLDGLRSITGPKSDRDLLRFLSAAVGSRLFSYIAFHSGSNSGIGRDQIHVYETKALPFPLPSIELVPPDAGKIVHEVADIFKDVERAAKKASPETRAKIEREGWLRVQPLIERYFSVTDAESILIEDTLTLSLPSIHRTNIDSDVPSLSFPKLDDRTRYADTLCSTLNQRARKHGIKTRAEGKVSRALNLIFLTVIFSDLTKPYTEEEGEQELWAALDRVGKAAAQENRFFNYLRGFSYFESDRLHILKPASMRNWCRTAALNDADAIFEHLVRQAE
jgi:hypothetical protein